LCRASLGDAYFFLQRYNEAVSAEQEAIRLSNGKYPYTHFRLGSALFELEQWKSAEASFEQAWQEDPKNDNAAYNVALCLSKQGYNLDAIQWYRRVLQINPKREDRDQIIKKIGMIAP
jgi:tetratricopeptide (TPR) repeat protein